MTDQTAGSDGMTASGIGATIPTALLTALLGRQSALPSDPVTVDARNLQVSVPPEVVIDLLRSLFPDREMSVAFATDAIEVSSPGLPAIRIEIPTDGLRVRVDERGLRLGDR